MKFYDLSKEKRVKRTEEIYVSELEAILGGDREDAYSFSNDEDTYIRKSAYQAIGKIYFLMPEVEPKIIEWLHFLLLSESEKARQTAIYACGEIAKKDFSVIRSLLERGLTDEHHSVRNAVTGALKNAGNKNIEVIKFCEKNIHSSDPEIRKLICHGLELRGREHPEDIIEILKLLQFDTDKKVKDMLIHVLGQISYKKGCFYFVAEEVSKWENPAIYEAMADEIIEVHGRYEKFSELKQTEVMEYFKKYL